ncbi:MAG: leucine-rich repeat protein [Mogibacterium sp.]|nr:leucine-rich repeat protein [Mogibacterium sp.]
MKERNRVFAILLAIMMVFTYMPGLAYAAAGDEPDPDVTVESQEEATVEEPVQEEPAEASEPAEADAPAEAAGPAETKAPAEAAEPEAENEAPAKAEAAQGKLSATGSAKMVPGAKIADNDELFEQYFSSEVDKALGKSVQKRGAKSPRAYNLNEIEQYIYSNILWMMQDIAYAKVSRAVVSIDLKDQLGDYLVDTGDAKYPWAITSESLGLEDGEAVFVPYESEEGTFWDLSEEAKANLFDIGKVVDAILLDQPYYAFWFDKIEGYLPEFNALLDTSGTGSDAHFAEEPNLTLSFTVAEAYRAADGADEFDVDSQKAESTLAAVASVEKIVAENGGKSDLEKLYAYKNKICDLTSYNYDAAQDPDMPYGDPWQLIYVFDGNEDTKVVCEGYAKAFQFLCDKSGFASSQIDCNTVTGEMMSDGGETEGHMWNILHMDDGRNYIADITNCDNDNPEEGYPDYLFLKGYSYGSVDDGYVYNDELLYQYDPETIAQYEYEDLEMSAYDYGEAGDDDDDEDAEYEWSGPDYIFSNGDAVFTLPEEAVVPEGCELDLRVGINTYEPDEGDHGWVLDFTEGKEYDFDRDTMTLTLHGPAVGEAINTEDSDYGRRISFFAGVIVDGGSGWLASGYSEFVYIDESISKVEFYGTNGRGTKENPIQLIENNGGYWDDHEGIEYYYYELDSFKAGDAVVVHYTDGTEKTFTFDDYYCEFCDSDSNFLEYWPQVIDDQTECENGWIINDAEPHKATVMIAGHETTVYYKVVANPVKSVSFQREGGVVLTEGTDGANSDGADGNFMEYWLEFRKGDTLTITVQEDENEDPVEKVYVGEEEEEEGSGDSTFKFVNTADKTDCLYYRDLGRDSDPQSKATEWKYNDGKEHWFTVEYMGVVSEPIPVTMLQNPVSSFIFERSGGVVLTEGVDGDYDTDDDGEEFFWYNLYFKPGDQLVVTGPDGKVKWYEAVPEDDEGDWVDRFVRRDAAGTGEFVDDDYIETYRISTKAQPRQWETHWTADGEGYSFELYFSGHEYTVPVTLAENQVKGISFSRAGYDDEHPVELMDRIDGWYDEEYEQFRYNLIFKEGDVLTVNYGDAEYDYIYTYSDDGMPDAFVLSEEYSDVPEDVPKAIRDDNIGTWGEDPEDEDEPWGIGEEHVCTIYYNGRTCEVSVVTVANPVENISFERDGYSEDDPIELKEGGDYSYEEDGVTKYVCPLEDGDRLVVKKDGSDIVYEFARIQTDEGAEERFVNTEDPDDVLVLPWDVWWDSEQSEGEEWYVNDIRPFTLYYMGSTCSIYVKIVEGSDGPDIPDDQIVTTLHPEADGSVRTIVRDEMSGEMNFPEDGDSVAVDGVTYTYDSASGSFKNGSDGIGWYLWSTGSDYDEDTDEYTFYFIVQYEKNGIEIGKSKIENVYGNEILSIEFTPNGRTELNASDIQDGEGGYDIEKRGNGSFFVEGDAIKLTNEFNGKTTVYEFTYKPDPEYQIFSCEDYGEAPTYAYCENPAIGENSVRIDMLGASTTTTIRIVDGGTHTHVFGNWEPYDANQHKRVCTIEGCGETEYADHTWNDGVVDPEPTDTEPGVKTFTCTACGETRTETVFPDGIIDMGTCGTDLTWKVDTTGTLTISGTGKMSNYYENSAPWSKDSTKRKITSIVIEEGVTSIGNYAFYKATNATSISIPSTVTTIGTGAFYGCWKLLAITIPDGVKKINRHTFCECKALVNLSLPDGLTTIDGEAFSGCQAIETIVIPDTVTELGERMFVNCLKLNSIVLPPGIETISDEMFRDCGFTSFTVPDTVTSIGWQAFGYTTKLASITIPESVTSIDKNAFQYGNSKMEIRGYSGSAAETFANTYNFKFVDIGAPAPHDCVGGDPVRENVVDSTCKAEGSYDEVVYCTICGKELSRTPKTIARKAHTEEVIPAVAATCTAKGSTEGKKCSVCGEILVAPQEIPAKGHSWGKATYAWDPDYTQVTGTRNCTVCHESVQAVAKRASYEVTKAPTTKEKGEIIYTSEAFTVEGFEVQTVKVELPMLTPAQAINQAQDQTNEADGKATAVENSTDEGAISDAEDAAAKAAAYAAMAEEAASDALEQASVDYARISKDPSATPEQIETATTNLKNAATNLAVAKQLTAAANSAVARTKKTAAKVAANKAAAAYNAAQSAANSTAAEQFRKEAEAYATTAAEKAGAADTASANAAKAVSDLEDLAKEMADSPVAEAVAGAIADAQNQANTSAGAASNAATDADKSKDNANESAGNAKTAVDNKKKAEAEAALDQAFNGIPDKKIKKVKGLKKSKMTKSAITVKWTKLSKKNLGGATKYEVWACPNKGFKRADTKFKTFSKGKSSGKISGLKKNTKYFVKVRAIRIVGGVKYVGPWSSAKGIKTKK